MVCCTLGAIKATTKMQMDTFILFLLCCIFCVYAVKFISMVIMKEIIFTCVMYAATFCVTNRTQ